MWRGVVVGSISLLMRRFTGRFCVRPPGSLEERGLLLVLLVVVSLAVPGAVAYRLLAQADAEQHSRSAEALLAVALGSYLEAGAGATREADEWLVRLAQQSQRVRWAGIFDKNGEGFEFRRRTSMRREDIVAQLPRGASGPVFRPLVVEGKPAPRFLLMAVPQPQTEAVLAAIIDLGPAGGRPDPLVLLGLAGTAVGGLAASLAWLYFTLLRPVQRLSRWIHEFRRGWAEAGPWSPPEELRQLIRSVEDTQRELEQWRSEAGALRSSLEERVAARTKRMSRALREKTRDAETDELTKLRNRRVLVGELPALFAEAGAHGHELALVLIDLDNLKAFNDARGHQAGDELLTFLGKLLRAALRRGSGLAARVGGDEFVLVLPRTTAADALALARHVRDLFLQRMRTIAAVDPPPGLSAGVAALKQHSAASVVDLLRMADRAMYFAKEHRLGVATIDDARAARPQAAAPADGAPPAAPDP